MWFYWNFLILGEYTTRNCLIQCFRRLYGIWYHPDEITYWQVNIIGCTRTLLPKVLFKEPLARYTHPTVVRGCVEQFFLNTLSRRTFKSWIELRWFFFVDRIRNCWGRFIFNYGIVTKWSDTDSKQVWKVLINRRKEEREYYSIKIYKRPLRVHCSVEESALGSDRTTYNGFLNVLQVFSKQREKTTR